MVLLTHYAGSEIQLWQVFALFDDTLLLADGRLVYQGAVRGMTDYFSTIGFDCGTNHNPGANRQANHHSQSSSEWEKQPSAASGKRASESGSQWEQHLMTLMIVAFTDD